MEDSKIEAVSFDNNPNENKKYRIFENSGIDRGLLLDVLLHFNDKLKTKDLTATMHIYGGCAIMLTCLEDRRSFDFDMVFETDNIAELVQIKREIENEYNFGGAFDLTIGPLLAQNFNKNDTVLYSDMSNLTVRLCSPKQLPAMKLFSARMGEEYNDFKDAITLCTQLGITKKEDMQLLIDEYIKPECFRKTNRMRTRIYTSDKFMDILEEKLCHS